MKAAVVVLLVVGASLGAGARAAHAESAASPADRAEAAARRVIDRRYQQALPLKPPEGTIKRPKDGDKPKAAPARDRHHRQRDPEAEGAASPLAGAMRMIVIVVTAIGVMMLVLWLLRDLKRGGDNPALDGEAAPEPTVDQGVLERPIGDADELARAGRYADAIHTLLLRTLVELVRATRTRVPAALTSREILARVPLVPPARAALDALVGAVEVSHFGDDVPGVADYERCRGEFQRFADAYRGAA